MEGKNTERRRTGCIPEVQPIAEDAITSLHNAEYFGKWELMPTNPKHNAYLCAHSCTGHIP